VAGAPVGAVDLAVRIDAESTDGLIIVYDSENFDESLSVSAGNITRKVIRPGNLYLRPTAWTREWQGNSPA